MWCKYCGNQVKDGTRFCVKCGKQLTTAVGQNHTQGATQGKNNVLPLKSDQIKKPATKQQASNGQQKKGMPVWLIILMIVAVICLIILGFVLGIILGRDGSSAKKENDTENSTEYDNESADSQDLSDWLADLEEDLKDEEAEVEEFIETEEVIEIYDSQEGGVHRYEFFVDDCTWSEAFYKAKQDGGYLVRINSLEEYYYIIGEIERLNLANIQFRIGGRRDSNSMEYYWVDEYNTLYGDKLNDYEYWAYSYWLDGEPSFVDGEIQEMYMDIYKKDEVWVWNDVPDDIISVVPYYSGKIGYIVEYED